LNFVDVNGRPFNAAKYNEVLAQLEELTSELLDISPTTGAFVERAEQLQNMAAEGRRAYADLSSTYSFTDEMVAA
jgi:hypothetical protein